MTPARYANRIVVRRDTATGLVMVGYATDMPLERFEHLEELCATRDSAPLRAGHRHFDVYARACARAAASNRQLLEIERTEAIGRGWVVVPLDLKTTNAGSSADAFGSYRAAAMQTLFRLSANDAEVWAVVEDARVVAVHARAPRRAMDALERAVWRRYWLRSLGRTGGRVFEGKLVAKDSGLWFCPEREVQIEPE